MTWNPQTPEEWVTAPDDLLCVGSWVTDWRHLWGQAYRVTNVCPQEGSVYLTSQGEVYRYPKDVLTVVPPDDPLQRYGR